MKIKILRTLLILIFLSTYSDLNAQTVFFDSKNIKIDVEDNMIFATEGVAKIPTKNLKIIGEKFIYDKLKSELIIFDNVEYIDEEKDITIKSQKMIYNESDNKVFTQSETFLDLENKYDIKSSNILFDRNLNIISSSEITEINDKVANKFIFEKGLIFDTIREIISSEKIFIKDQNLNEYSFENSKLNLKDNEVAGKDVKVDFVDNFFGNEDNDPILKGSSIVSNNQNTKIYKTVFSTCNKKNKNCRGWELQSEIFTHNKTKKLFEYEKSWFKVFDNKIFYLPYFNHPDPTVKRKSGFLSPFYKGSSNLGSSVTVPYFYSISNSKDLTFKPRFYFDNDYIFQSEYREAFKNSNLITDFSFNRKDNTSSHFFTELKGKFEDNSNYKIQIQNVTNDSYLKIHNIKEYTSLIDSESTLASYISLEKDIDENTKLDTTIKLYEDLSKEDNDKYQYIFPDFNFSKNINLEESYNGNLQFMSTGFQKIYETNKYEALINNDFNFNSFDYITKKGIVSDYSLLLKNFNTYSENSTVYEKKNDHEIFATLLLKSELPLKKELENSTNLLKPILQLRVSPTNGKNISSSDTRIEFDNLFSPNRIGRSDMVEKGNSITLGVEFEKQKHDDTKLLGLSLGNVFKDKKNDDLPSKTKLNQTRSDIVGNLYYKLNNNLEVNYDFSYDKDLEYSNYDSINATFGLNKFITSFDYITENHDFGDSEVVKNDTSYKFTDEHVINFNTTKDLKDDFTQFYKLSYEYETDCLLASFEYQKKFFRDGSLVPDESLVFLIKFIPFVDIRGAANSVFEN